MTQVGRRYLIAEFESRDANEQVGERQPDATRGILAVNLAGQ